MEMFVAGGTEVTLSRSLLPSTLFPMKAVKRVEIMSVASLAHYSGQYHIGV